MAGDFESSLAVEKRSSVNSSEDKEGSSPETKCCGCVLVIWLLGKYRVSVVVSRI